MLAASSGESDGDSDYVELHKKLPTISTSMLELVGRIHGIQQMQKVDTVNINAFYQPK